MHSDLIIRPVTENDAPRLLEIFGPYVEHTAVSFDWEVPSPEAFIEKIHRITLLHPWLAAVKDGIVIGYAYASPFKVQAAYCWSVETSIYLDPQYQHQGVGRILYTHLEDILRRQNIVNAPVSPILTLSASLFTNPWAMKNVDIFTAPAIN